MPNEFIYIDEELILYIVLHQEVGSLSSSAYETRDHILVLNSLVFVKQLFFFYQNIDYSVQTNNLRLIKINSMPFCLILEIIHPR